MLQAVGQVELTKKKHLGCRFWVEGWELAGDPHREILVEETYFILVPFVFSEFPTTLVSVQVIQILILILCYFLLPPHSVFLEYGSFMFLPPQCLEQCFAESIC